MIRKKLTFLLLLIVAVCYTSCDDDTIYIDPVGDTEAGFFQTEEQMTQAVMGIYQKITFFQGFRGGSPLSVIWLLPSDDLTTQGGLAYESFVALNSNDGNITNFFRYAYQLIARANTVLQKIEENGETAYIDSPELRDYHKGEALFLRAWMYFRLWNVHGSRAPLIDERITSFDDAYPPSSTGTQLLDQAITDLTEAASLLPDSWDDFNAGRVTKNSAYGLKGKVLVFRGSVSGSSQDFSDAITAFNAISGASLMPFYGDNFDATKENNAESLFEYQANETGAITNPFLHNDDFSVVGERAMYIGFYNRQPGWVGANVLTATESLISAYEGGDPRIAENIDLAPSDVLLNVVKYTKRGNTVGSWAASYNEQRNNARILRYADVLLLKAEAIARSGGSLSEAMALVNEVRARARMMEDGTMSGVPANLDVNQANAAAVLDIIFNERRLELAFEEGHRWFDLRRRHLAGDIDLNNWDFSSQRTDTDFADKYLYFPLPSEEVIQNSGLENPGY